MDSPESKMRLPDRILVLSTMDGKKPKDSIGQIDPRLFTGDNKLHAVMDLQTSLWHFKYEMGAIPGALAGQFTSFDILKKHADFYFNKRNILISEVID